MNRRDFIKGLGLSLASLFCLGTKKPDDYEAPLTFTAKTSIEEFPEPIRSEMQKAYDALQQASDDALAKDAADNCEIELKLSYEDLRDFWPMNDTLYFSRPYKQDCSNCNQYLCGPSCDYWWQRRYFEPNAKHGRVYLSYRHEEEFIASDGLNAHHAALDRLYESLGYPFVSCENCTQDCPSDSWYGGCHYGKVDKPCSQECDECDYAIENCPVATRENERLYFDIEPIYSPDPNEIGRFVEVGQIDGKLLESVEDKRCPEDDEDFCIQQWAKENDPKLLSHCQT